MMPTRAVNVPVPPEATGYECDKFSKEAVETHLNALSRAWVDYLRRCHYMLQQGDSVSDLCYFSE